MTAGMANGQAAGASGAVNPYTFVPLSTPPNRTPPAGHADLAPGHFSGSFTATITTASPLLLGGLNNDEPGPPTTTGSGPARAFIPGSGLAGAVRSVHEALTDSCLRIIDLDYRPVHRHAVTVGIAKGLQLAVVTEATDGLPTQVTLCTESAWLHYDVLPSGTPGPDGAPTTDMVWKTGTRLRIPDERLQPDENRGKVVTKQVTSPTSRFSATSHDENRGKVVPKQVTEVTDGAWVLLVTDTKPRNPEFGVWYAVGRLGGQNEVRPVSQDARRALGRALEDADDLHEHHLPGARDGYVDVLWPLGPDKRPVATSRVVGRRWKATTSVPLGHPVWVATSGNDVTEIRLSQAWRHLGKHPVGDRLWSDHPSSAKPRGPGPWAPCTKATLLCPSCRLLGSAGDDGEDQGTRGTAQESYRGHVRFTDAIATSDIVLTRVTRAPLSSPRPSAGQFYLENQGWAGKAAPQPLAQWGSEADRNGPRRIRGRKFYWRTAQKTAGGLPEGNHRGLKRTHHSTTQTKEVALIPAGVTFETSVAFDNLSLAQLGSLLAAAEPRLLWAQEPIVSSVGGGRPFGWGAIHLRVSSLTSGDAHHRYLDTSGSHATVEQAVEAFRATANPEALSAVRTALTLNYVRDQDVWYPPGTGAPGDESYDQGFEFWQNSAGLKLSRKDRPLVALPRVNAQASDQRVWARERATGSR